MTNIKAEWDKLSTDEQITFMTCCVRKAANREFDNPAQFIINHGIEALVNETWLTLMDRINPETLDIINSRRAKNGNGEITLTSLVYRAARSAILIAYRAEHKTITIDLEAIAVIPGMEDITQSVEIQAAISKALTGRDRIDNQIISYIESGFTMAEIAAAVGISTPAIHKRIVKLRTAIAEQIA